MAKTGRVASYPGMAGPCLSPRLKAGFGIVSLSDRKVFGGSFTRKELAFRLQNSIYIDPVAKNPGGPATLAEFIARDEAEYMSSDPNLSIKDIAPYLPGLDYRFTMREFDDSANNYYQALAFYEGEKAYFVIVLSCRSPSERDENRGALLELLDSFTYIQEE